MTDMLLIDYIVGWLKVNLYYASYTILFTQTSSITIFYEIAFIIFFSVKKKVWLCLYAYVSGQANTGSPFSLAFSLLLSVLSPSLSFSLSCFYHCRLLGGIIYQVCFRYLPIKSSPDIPILQESTVSMLQMGNTGLSWEGRLLQNPGLGQIHLFQSCCADVFQTQCHAGDFYFFFLLYFVLVFIEYDMVTVKHWNIKYLAQWAY